MNLWKVILVTLVIFSTGVITGGLIARRTSPKSSDLSSQTSIAGRTNHTFKPERALRMDFLGRVKEELDLSPSQLEQIEAIIRESQARTREIWDQCAPQMHAEFKATKERIWAVLTPEQREKFDELMARRRPPRKEDREHGPKVPSAESHPAPSNDPRSE